MNEDETYKSADWEELHGNVNVLWKHLATQNADFLNFQIWRTARQFPFKCHYVVFNKANEQGCEFN